MRVTRARIAIPSIGVAFTIVALGVGAMRQRRFEDLQRTDHLPRAGMMLKALPPQAAPGSLVPPPLDEPFDVPLPPVSGEKYWGLFPALGDLDGDGRPDLMVGSGLGRMRFYRNVGTATRPQFAPPVWFDDLCPNGRIPTG